VDRPDGASYVSAMNPLTDAQVDAFYERGFFVQEDVFGRGELASMREAFDRLERIACQFSEPTIYRGTQFVVQRVPYGEGTRARIDRIVWCGAAEPILSSFGRDPRLVSMSARLLGSDSMEQLINQAHFKLPGDGVSFPWHQDSSHRRYGQSEWNDVNGRGSYVQTIVALDEVTEDNGPIELIPEGSGDLAAYGLDPPQAIVRMASAGRPVATLEFGERNPTRTAVYARRPDQKQVYLLGLNAQYYLDLIFEQAAGGRSPAGAS